MRALSNKRHAARTDENEKAIVKALRKMGYTVQPGHDDILVGASGRTYWFEVKDPAKTLKRDGSFRKGALKPSQIKLRAEWRGHYAVVTCLEDILAQIQRPQTPKMRAS